MFAKAGFVFGALCIGLIFTRKKWHKRDKQAVTTMFE